MDITKSDVPYRYRSPVLRLATVLVVVGLLVAEVICGFVSALRPTAVEVAVGGMLGIPSGLAYSIIYLAYVKDTSDRGRLNPKLSGLASFWVAPGRMGCLQGIAAGVLLMFGLAGTTLVLRALRGVVPALPVGNGVVALGAYLVCMIGIPRWQVIRWYDSLPDA